MDWPAITGATLPISLTTDVTGTLPVTNGGTGVTTSTGTGSTVLSTTPIFSTNITVPLIIGGTAAGSSLILQSTSGVGSGDSIIIKGGNNGATTFATSLAGELRVHSATDVTEYARIVQNGANQVEFTTAPTSNDSLLFRVYANSNIEFSINNGIRWTIGDSVGPYTFYPIADNTNPIGKIAQRVSAIYATSIRSGSTDFTIKTGSSDIDVIIINSSTTIPANTSAYCVSISPTLTEASSGIHPEIAALRVTFTINNGTATVTDLMGIEIPTFAAATGTTNATSLRVTPPTGATNNYAINVISGISKFGGPITLKGYTVAGLPTGVQGHTAFCTDLLAPTFLATATGGGTIVGVVFYDGTNWKTI